MTMVGLGKMKATFDSLSVDLKANIESCLLHSLPGMGEQEVSNIIGALGLMGYQWASSSPMLQHALQTAVVAQLANMPHVGIAMSLRGLANMGAKWTDLIPEVKDGVDQAVISMLHSNELHAKVGRALANVVFHLGTMEADWNSFSSSFHSVVMKAFVSVRNKLSQQDRRDFKTG